MHFEQNNNGDLVAIFTEKEADIFRKWLDKQLKIEEAESLENRIAWAKLFLKTAKELYPNKKFECWVDENSTTMHFEVKREGRFFTVGEISSAEVVSNVRQHLDKQRQQDQKVQKRHYIS
jgi:hypothetical protein